MHTKYDMQYHLLFGLHNAISFFTIDVIIYQVKLQVFYNVKQPY